MEIHRLKEMKEGYSEELFNKLYQETRLLRKSLANQIDCRRYGVSRDIIESWFDDKFIFVFNKYFEEKEPDMLKGYLINALKTFKFRMLRKAYNNEGLFYCSLVELEGESELINIIPNEETIPTSDVFFNLASEFMKKNLSDNAYMLFQIQMSPPPYIIQRLNKHNSRIPNFLVAQYLGFDNMDDNSIDRFIKSLKKEINLTLKSAKEFFENNPVALNQP